MDKITKSQRSENMRKIRSKNTKCELRVQKALTDRNITFRPHDNLLPGKPDIVLDKPKIAIQVWGCFWHGHTCIDGHIPKTNKRFWSTKLQTNTKRDKRNLQRLRRLGWSAFTIWECQVSQQRKLDAKLSAIAKAIQVRQNLDLREPRRTRSD